MMRFLRRQRSALAGQTTVEYAILAFWTVLIAVGAIEAVRLALLDYYYDVVSLMCLPIP